MMSKNCINKLIKSIRKLWNYNKNTNLHLGASDKNLDSHPVAKTRIHRKLIQQHCKFGIPICKVASPTSNQKDHCMNRKNHGW
mmetsp:Transcript_43184/g.125784  ORF Transcript_43184/g.125784 Transcript_43184/m.125784 type:complete len:83 (-) Transcript_43184:82-330(-)